MTDFSWGDMNDLFTLDKTPTTDHGNKSTQVQLGESIDVWVIYRVVPDAKTDVSPISTC